MRRFIGLLAVCAMGVYAAPAAAQTTDPFKTFTLRVAPDQVEIGETVTFTATITNTAKDTQKLGSANIVVPDAIQDPRLKNGARLKNHTVELRYLGLAPGKSHEVEIVGTVPTQPGRYVWNARAKQSDTFSESSNDWTLTSGEADRDTNVFVPSSCTGVETCTARHYVPLAHVQSFDANAAPGDYYVDTTITLDPVDGVQTASTDDRQVTVEYLDPSTQANADSACEGLITYREPSDAAALFSGIGPKTVTFSLSPALAGVVSPWQAPRSCLSAPAVFETDFAQADSPFMFGGELWFNGLLYDCTDTDRLRTDSPCVEASLRQDDAWSVTIDFPESNLIGPDPMNR